MKDGQFKNGKEKTKYSYRRLRIPHITVKKVAVIVIIIIAVALFYLSKSIPTAQIVGRLGEAVNPTDPSTPTLRFSRVDFAYFINPDELGVSGSIPPDMYYCHNKLSSINSNIGIGFMVVSVTNRGGKPISLTTSTLNKLDEVQVDIYNEVIKDNFGRVISYKSIFERTCSNDGIMRFITSRQAGYTDPIILRSGQSFEFLGILGTAEKSTFCGKSYPINMMATAWNNKGELQTYDLDSKTLTVKC